MEVTQNFPSAMGNQAHLPHCMKLVQIDSMRKYGLSDKTVVNCNGGFYQKILHAARYCELQVELNKN